MIAVGAGVSTPRSTPLGPVDPARSADAARMLAAARAAAEDAGVTRLADLTRLDRLGLPVWQAVRPMSLALSVHQGKGATDADAQVGALLEAVESDAAERFEADGPVCPFGALPPSQRAETIGDFAFDRSRPPNGEAHRWVAAEDLLSGGTIHVPFDTVSLDLTRNLDSRFERSSNGIGTGASRDEAIAVAVHEFIERDSVTQWKAGRVLTRMTAMIEPETVPFDWFQLWRGRILGIGAQLRCYRIPSVSGTPVIGCEINDPCKNGYPYGANQGRGCHPVPEVALFKALAEAMQARCTYIAGARDDLFPSEYAYPETASVRIAFAVPLPRSMRGIDWQDITPGPSAPAGVAEALALAGYPRIAVVSLARPHGLSVVRVFVCGLGSMQRRRRRRLP